MFGVWRTVFGVWNSDSVRCEKMCWAPCGPRAPVCAREARGCVPWSTVASGWPWVVLGWPWRTGGVVFGCLREHANPCPPRADGRLVWLACKMGGSALGFWPKPRRLVRLRMASCMHAHGLCSCVCVWCHAGITDNDTRDRDEDDDDDDERVQHDAQHVAHGLWVGCDARRREKGAPCDRCEQ